MCFGVFGNVTNNHPKEENATISWVLIQQNYVVVRKNSSMLFSISSTFSKKQKIVTINFDPREGNSSIQAVYHSEFLFYCSDKNLKKKKKAQSSNVF